MVFGIRRSHTNQILPLHITLTSHVVPDDSHSLPYVSLRSQHGSGYRAFLVTSTNIF